MNNQNRMLGLHILAYMPNPMRKYISLKEIIIWLLEQQRGQKTRGGWGGGGGGGGFLAPYVINSGIDI